jgi:hypothetical protein
MTHALEAAVRSFVSAHRDADLLEAVVDTSVHGPCLNLWAWRIQQGKHFDDAMRDAADTQDWGILADIVDELGSSTFEIRLSGVYPDWPDAIAPGDRALVQMLEAAAARLPASTRFLFHHVDGWPAVAIRTGSPFPSLGVFHHRQ